MLKEQLIRYIEKLKEEGRDKLLPDRKLCEKFNVSRPTIMKELAQLVGEGVIVRRRGSGTFIAEKDPAKVSMTIGAGLRNALFYPNNYFPLKIINAISRECEILNIELQLFDRMKDIFKRNESNNNLVKSIENRILDGFILCSRMPMEITLAISRKIPVVSLNNVIDASDITCVTCDYFGAGYIATDYLCSKGHKNIGFVAGDPNHPEVWKNISAAKQVLKNHGIPFSSENLEFIKGVPQKKVEKIIDFYKRGNFTAVYFINNIISDSLNKLIESGLTTENNLSVIVSGDYGEFERYGITAVDTKIEEVCTLGVKLLYDKMNNVKVKSNYNIIDPEIIERDSIKSI